jgi:methylmalonyl-CoA mutase, C-terminal domain
VNTQSTPGRRGRVVVAKVGLDGHDRGAKILSRLLSSEGFEVIYLGVRNTAEQVAAVAQQECADVVALSILSGAHVEVASAVRQALDARECAYVAIAIGGLIPQHDADALHAVGVARCFHPGQETGDPGRIARAIDALVAQSRQAAAAVGTS